MKYNGKELVEMIPKNWDGKSREMLVWDDESLSPYKKNVVGYNPMNKKWIFLLPIDPNDFSVRYGEAYHCTEIPNEEIHQVQRVQSIDEMVETLNAYKKGKKIECRFKDRTMCDSWSYIEKPDWNWAIFEYRVKPESTYRPYKNLEEFKKDIVSKYGGSTFENIIETRNIWLKDKYTEYMGQIVSLNNEHIFVDCNYYAWRTLFDEYTYLDGSPFGIEE